LLSTSFSANIEEILICVLRYGNSVYAKFSEKYYLEG